MKYITHTHLHPQISTSITFNEKTKTWPQEAQNKYNNRVNLRISSLEQQVLVGLLRQHVGRLRDGPQLSKAFGDFQLRPFPELLLLLLDLLQPEQKRVTSNSNV